MEVDTFLAHHGVKGMKWGVRKLGESGYGKNAHQVRSNGKLVKNSNRTKNNLNKADKITSAIETGVGKGLTRKEIRTLNKQQKKAYDLNKVTEAYAESKEKGERVLIKSRAPGDYADTVMTGKQFVTHLESGGVIDIASTRVFARQEEGQQYIRNAFENEVYRPIKRK